MRFAEISLEGYGVYEKLSVPFDSPGLTVVYGLNEAGKSTCLAAISDFLFGIPHNSSRGQHYGYDRMRIGATLLLADGTRVELNRRKGRGRTLLDTDGQPIDESVLSGLFGTLSRERFGTMFGLDHSMLRQGGENLLKAEGDIGRLIVEAGGGLRTLVDHIKELERETDSLFANRRSENRKFYMVYDQFAAAEKDVRDGALTFDAYRQARERLDGAKKKHEELAERRKELERQRSAMERAHRVLPLLSQLDQIDRENESYSDVSYLRPEFATDGENTLKEREQTHNELNESAKRCGDLESKITGLIFDQVVLESEAEIRTIKEKSVHVAKEREDRSKRERELEEQEVRLRKLCEYLKLGPDADLNSCLPPADVRERVRYLASNGKSLAGRIADLEEELSENQFELESIRRKQQELEKQGFNRSVDIDLTALKTLPRLMREGEERSQQADGIEEEINRRLAALGFGAIEDLRDLRCPDLDTIEVEIKQREKLEKQIEDYSTRLRQEEEKLVVAQKTIERLQAAGEVPTDAAIDQARSARKVAWQPIRSVYLSDNPDVLRSTARPERESKANQLEERIEEADRLGDRKSAEAQRVTDLAAAEKERDEATVAIQSSQNACKEAEDRLVDQCRRFSKAWPQAVQTESDLGRLKQLVRERETIQQRAGEASKLRGEAKARLDEADAALANLAPAESALGLHPDPKARLERRLFDLEQAVNAYKQGHDEWLRNAAKLEELEKQLAKVRGELEKLKTAHSQWRRNWDQAMNQIQLPPDCTVEFVEQVIKEWPEAGSALAIIGSAQHRLNEFDRDEKDLVARIGELSPQLGFKLPDDSVAAAKMLSERLEQFKQLEAERRTLNKQLYEAIADRNSRQQKLDALNRRVQGLCDEAKADESSLGQIAGRLQLLIQMRQSRAQKLGEVSAAGDGKSLEELHAECKGLDLDTIKAELEGIGSEKERLDQEI